MLGPTLVEGRMHAKIVSIGTLKSCFHCIRTLYKRRVLLKVCSCSPFRIRGSCMATKSLDRVKSRTAGLGGADTIDAHERRKDYLNEAEVDKLHEGAWRSRHGTRDGV